MRTRVQIAGVAASLPVDIRTSAMVEKMVEDSPGGFKPRSGIVHALSGIRERRVAAEGVQCSDLAVDACRQVLAATGVDLPEVDLLIYASAGQDLIEPATAHIIQSKLGTNCPVFDVKNACNSFLNGVQLAESLIVSGSCKTALVSVGEISSRGVDWKPRNAREFKRNLPGYTMGDAGAAAIVTAVDNDRGIFYRRFSSASDHWNLMTLAGGGSMHPHGDEHNYIRTNGPQLQGVFRKEGLPFLRQAMREANLDFTDFQRIFVHQVTLPYLYDMLDESGIPPDLVEETIINYGNLAAATIPVGMARAFGRGAIGPGDRVLCVGLASGISIGVMMIDL